MTHTMVSMFETHRLAAIMSAAFLLVVLCMSWAGEVSSVELAQEAVPTIERTGPIIGAIPANVASVATAVDTGTAVVPVDTSTEEVPENTTPTPVQREVAVQPSPVAPVPETTPVAVAPAPVPKEVTRRTSTGDFLSRVASAIHAATNDERRAVGLSPLVYDATLARNAKGYSENLLESGVLSHTDPSGCAMTCRFKLAGYEAQAWGENLAEWQSSYEPTVDELVEYFVAAWLKSDGHRDNVLSPTFTHEGVGVARDGNTFYVTVHFSKP